MTIKNVLSKIVRPFVYVGVMASLVALIVPPSLAATDTELTITASVTPQDAYPGEQVKVSYVVSNNTKNTLYWSESADKRIVADPIPAWLTDVKTDLGGDAYYSATTDSNNDGKMGDWVFNKPTVSPGTTYVFNFQGVVPTDAKAGVYSQKINFNYQSLPNSGSSGITKTAASLPMALNVVDHQVVTNGLSVSGSISPAYLEPGEAVSLVYTLDVLRDTTLANKGKVNGFIPDWVDSHSLTAKAGSGEAIECDLSTCILLEDQKAGSSYKFSVDGFISPKVAPGTTYQHDWNVEEIQQLGGILTSQYQVNIRAAILGGAPQMQVRANVSPSIVAPSDSVKYQFVVTNNETIFAPSDATLLAKLPDGIIYESSSVVSSGTDSKGTATFDPVTGLFDITHFTAGEAYGLSILAKVNNAQPASTIIYPVTLTHIYQLEGIPVDFTVVSEAIASLGVKPNDAPPSVALPPASHGSISLSSDKSELEVGEEVTLTTQVVLREGQNVYGGDLTVTQTVPDGLEIISSSAKSSRGNQAGPYSDDNLIAFNAAQNIWTVQNPAPNDVFELVLKAKVKDSAPAAMIDTATLSYPAEGGINNLTVSLTLSVLAAAPPPPSGGGGGYVPPPVEPPPASPEPVRHSHGGGSHNRGTPTPQSAAVEYEIYLRNLETGEITKSSDWNAGIVPGGSNTSGTLAFEPEADNLRSIFFNDVYFSYYSNNCTASGFWMTARQTPVDYQVGLRTFVNNTLVKDMVLFNNLQDASNAQRIVDFGALIGKPCTSATLRSTVLPQTCQPAMCQDMGLYLSIVNPDQTVRETISPFAQITRLGNRKFNISFEDRGWDMDFNDVVIDLDVSNCSAMTATQSALDASWHHQVRANLTYKGQPVRHLLISPDTQASQGQTVEVNAYDYIQCAR